MKLLFKTTVAIALLALAIAVFYGDVLIRNEIFIHSGLINSDLNSFNFPLKSHLSTTLQKNHSIPYWTDLVGTGFPITAEGQVGSYYLIHQLLFSLPLTFAILFNLDIIVHIAISGIGMFVLLAYALKRTYTAAVFGAIIWICSGIFIQNIQHSNVLSVVVYLPLMVYLSELIITLPKVGHSTARSLSLISGSTLLISLQLTAGHIETFYYTILYSSLYLLLRFMIDPETRSLLLRKITILLISSVLALLITLPQLNSTYELVQNSQRDTGISIDQSISQSWPLQSFAYFINPNAFPYFYHKLNYQLTSDTFINLQTVYPYIGLLPLLFFVIGVVSLPFQFKKSQSNRSTFNVLIVFTLLTTIVTIYAVGGATQLFSILWEVLPGLKLFRYPTKALYLVIFSVIIIAVAGFEVIINRIAQLIKNNIRFKLTTIAAVILLICFFDLYIGNKSKIIVTKADSWLSTPPTARFLNQKAEEDQTNYPAAARTFLNWRIYTRGVDLNNDKLLLDSQIQKELRSSLSPNTNIFYRLPISDVYAALLLKNHTRIKSVNLSISSDNQSFTISPQLRNSLALQSVRFLVSDIIINSPEFNLVQSFPNAKRYTQSLAISTNEFLTIPSTAFYIYENSRYLPRIRFVPNSSLIFTKRVEKDGANILQQLFNPDFDPSQHTLIEAKITSLEKDTTPGKFTVVYYTPEKYALITQTDSSQYLVVSDSRYPGWQATIDNKVVPIFTANYYSRAIQVPQGRHLVVFKYIPTLNLQAKLISQIGYALLISTAVLSFFIGLWKTFKVGER